jgi:hypothetical protein
MKASRPGGPMRASWVVDEGDVVLELVDIVNGGGTRMHFDTPAYAQAWLDALTYDLDVLTAQPHGIADEGVA